jgi:hypothetical protein
MITKSMYRSLSAEQLSERTVLRPLGQIRQLKKCKSIVLWLKVGRLACSAQRNRNVICFSRNVTKHFNVELHFPWFI